MTEKVMPASGGKNDQFAAMVMKLFASLVDAAPVLSLVYF
jgi:hypothetical protein